MRIWERQENESVQAYSAFRIFLELQERSLQKVVQKCAKSLSLIKRWSAKYDWKSRAVAYDNSLFELARQDTGNLYRRLLTTQFKNNQLLINKAMKAFSEANMSKVSPKTLNEILHMAFDEQLKIAEILKFNNVTEGDEYTIRIIKADGKGHAG